LEGRREYCTEDESHRVYVFSKDGGSALGINVPFVGIFMNKDLFENYSKRIRDFVFLHELGHSKQNKVIKFFLSIIAAALVVFSALFLISAVIFLFLFPFLSFGYLVRFLLSLFSLRVFICILESHAELFAVKKIGLKEYNRVLKEIKGERSKKNIIRKFINWFKRPSPKLVKWAYEKYD